MKRLASLVLGVVIIFGAIRAYVLFRDSFPTPMDAVNDHITRITVKSHSPQKIESLNVVSSTATNRERNEQLLLFQANDQGLQTHIAGYATIKKSLFGWYVDNFQMTGKSPLPSDVMVGQGWSGRGPIIYGQVFLANAASIEAVFSDGTISADLPQGSFAVLGTPYSEFTMLKILDVDGNVLKQLTNEELQNR
ncbi:MAG TPA: hypothetical protein VK206_25945 [Anaerolineales bacterium]|nr:hypothetical protein [Anaerolineales bacterium]